MFDKVMFEKFKAMYKIRKTNISVFKVQYYKQKLLEILWNCKVQKTKLILFKLRIGSSVWMKRFLLDIFYILKVEQNHSCQSQTAVIIKQFKTFLSTCLVYMIRRVDITQDFPLPRRPHISKEFFLTFTFNMTHV